MIKTKEALMSVGLNTKASTPVLIEKEEISSPRRAKEKLVMTRVDNKSKKATPPDQRATFSQTISHQRDPVFIQFLFDQTVIPLIESLRDLKIVKHVLSADEISTIRDTAAESLLYRLLRGGAENSIALRMETLRLAILKINTMSAGVDKVPRKSADTFLASLAVEYCVKRLIKSTGSEKNSDGVWNSEEGKQFFVDLSILNEQHFNCGFTTPMDLLIYKLETAAYQDPKLQRFITSTTYGEYKAIKKIVYKHKDDISDETQLAVVKEAAPYFSESLRKAYFVFSLRLDSLKLNADFKNAHLFRKNTIATVRVMKKTERMKHLKFLNLKPIPDGLEVLKKSIIIEKVAHTLTLAVEKKTKCVKIITLTKESSEDVDVYLFGQIVTDPHQTPDPQTEPLLLKFEMTAGTNLIWLKEADEGVKKAIASEFEKNIYAPSIYTAIKFKEEIVLVEIFKQLGFSLNSRTRAGTIQTYIETLRAKYDDDYKESLSTVLESSLGAPINQYLAKCYHNKDLDMVVQASPMDQKHMTGLTKLAIKHITSMAESSNRKNEYPFKWVFKSILAAGYDDPTNPVDIGNDSPPPKKAERVNLNLLREPLETALTEKAADKILLGLAEIISESIISAFTAQRKFEGALKMLEGNFKKEELDSISKEDSTNTKVRAIFKKLLVEWDLTCTERQALLFDRFFKHLK